MKKNFKIITLGLTTVAASMAPMTVLSNCSKNKSVDAIASTLKGAVLDEFYWICKHYRPTFNNRWFCEQLVRRIKHMGYTPVYDYDSYVPIEIHKSEPYGFNMYFDVPATADGKDIPNIIIQAHTDMVAVAVEGYDWVKGVVPVIDADGTMHTKDHQSSLGADDGIGVAIILAFAKNPNLFKHGNVRCILTVDEEDGDSGAASLPESWFDDYDYFLNLDGEHINLTGCGCGGCQQAIWQTGQDYAAFENQPNKYQYSITGLKGGHSAHVMHENRINSIVFMFEIIKAINNAHTDANVQLVWAHDNTDDAATTGNSTTGGTIPREAHFMISSKNAISDIDTIVQKVVAEQLAAHPIEDKSTVKVASETVRTGDFGNGLSNEATMKLAAMITDDTKEKKLYGVIVPPLDPEKHPDWPVTSCNIGAFRIGKDVYPFHKDGKEGDNNAFYLELFGRTSDPDTLGPKPVKGVEPKPTSYMGRFEACALAQFTDLKTNPWESIGYNFPWPNSAGNTINLLVHKAADTYGYPMEDDIRVGWIEMGAIVSKKRNIQIGTLGPELNDVHSVNEHLDTNTLIPMFKMFMYVLSNLGQK